MRKSLGAARGALYEFETQNDLACNLGFIDQEPGKQLLELATEVAKLINGLLGALNP